MERLKDGNIELRWLFFVMNKFLFCFFKDIIKIIDIKVNEVLVKYGKHYENLSQKNLGTGSLLSNTCSLLLNY